MFLTLIRHITWPHLCEKTVLNLVDMHKKLKHRHFVVNICLIIIIELFKIRAYSNETSIYFINTRQEHLSFHKTLSRSGYTLRITTKFITRLKCVMEFTSVRFGSSIDLLYICIITLWSVNPLRNEWYIYRVIYLCSDILLLNMELI